MNPDDPLEQLKALKTATAPSSDPLEELKRLKAPPMGNKPKIGQMGHAITTDESPEDPSYAQQALGGIASFDRNIPGAEVAQAGVRSVVRRQPYTEALSDIRGGEESANKWVRRGNSLVGGVVAAAAAPGRSLSPALQGAGFGAAEGALSADPVSLGERVGKTAKGAAVGAVAGKVLGELAPNVARVIKAKSLGSTALQRTSQMEAADAASYGKAATEGAGATHPDVTAALNSPDIKPYADAIRNSRTFAGADDATVLREVYKRLGERQRELAARVANAANYKAGASLEKADIGLAKGQLMSAAEAGGSRTIPAVTRDIPAVVRPVPPVSTAQSPHLSIREAVDAFQRRSGAAASRTEGTVAQQMARQTLERHSAENVLSPRLSGGSTPRPATVEMSPARTEVVTPARTVKLNPVMPSLREAVEGHANLAGQMETFKAAGDATNRIARGVIGAGRNLTKSTPEAFKASIPKMSPDEARAALEGVMGRLQSKTGRTGLTSGNPIKLFGLPKSAWKVNKLASYIDALDKQAGNVGKITKDTPWNKVGYLRRALGIAAGQEMTR